MTTPIQPDQSESPKQSLTGARLSKHADYQRAYAASRKRQSASMSWFLAPRTPAGAAFETPSDHPSDEDLSPGTPAGHPGDEDLSPGTPAGPRVGLTAGKVLGKAHERNRIKRRMREALRRHVELLPEGCDLILHPRRAVLTMEFAKLEGEIVRILNQAKAEAARMKQHSAPLAAPKAPPAAPQVL
jgi:ribonuclease P protein component